MCCLKKNSSLVSHFFSTIFSFSKLICIFWQIARLQDFFINYRIGSHKHLDKLLLPPFVVLLLFHHLLLPGWGTWMDEWWDGWRDEWMETTTIIGVDRTERPLKYYILGGTRDLRTLWSPPVSLKPRETHIKAQNN